MPGFEIVSVAPSHCLATFDQVAVLLVGGSTPVSLATSVRGVVERLIRDYPRYAFMTVNQPNAPAPTPEVRKVIAEIMKAVGKEDSCRVFVHEGRGFSAAMIRSVIAGISFVTARRTEVFSTIEAAAGHVTTDLALHHKPAFARDLLEAVSTMRQRMQACA